MFEACLPHLLNETTMANLTLPQQLTSNDFDTQKAALDSIDGAVDATVLEVVSAIVIDPAAAEVVREKAAEAMGRMRMGPSREMLLEWSQSADGTIRTLAATGLGNDPSPESRTRLVELLSDAMNKVRNLAERGLLKQEDQLADVIDPLLELLSAEQPLTQSPAARLLGVSQNERALQPLLELTQSETWLVRMWSCKGLGDLGRSDAVDTLVARMQTDEKNRVRAAATEAIAQLAPSNAAELLQDRLENDDDEGVQQIARESLMTFGYDLDD